MNIVKIKKIAADGTATVTERDYKSVEIAQDSAFRKSVKEPDASFKVVVFNINIESPEKEFSSSRFSKGDAHVLRVIRNKAHRTAVKEQREVEMWRKADERFTAKVVRTAKTAVRNSELEYKAAIREEKEIGRWEKSDGIYHDRMGKRTLREMAEIEKWEKYNDKFNDSIVK